MDKIKILFGEKSPNSSFLYQHKNKPPAMQVCQQTDLASSKKGMWQQFGLYRIDSKKIVQIA